MNSDEDSDGEETASAIHLSGSQLSAQAKYLVNYGHTIIESMMDEKEEYGDLEKQEVTTSFLPCKVDEIIESDVDPFIAINTKPSRNYVG